MSLTLCLCCGERYESVCPNMIDGQHSMLHASNVATILRDWGIEHPEPQDVHRALVFLTTGIDPDSGHEPLPEPEHARPALEELRRRYPDRVVVLVASMGEGEYWTLVRAGQEPFAIWNYTGALYTMDGPAVSDDPIWTPL